MPTYACDECDKAFNSKDALRSHMDQHEDGGASIDITGKLAAVWNGLRRLNRKQLGILFAILLMSTLFVGTAFFTATTTNVGGGGGDRQGRYVNPLTGYSADRVPDPSTLSLPQGYVATEQLSDEEQLYLLVAGSTDNGPSILLQYSCTNCPEVVDRLQRVAQQYQGYVYVAPYQDMDSTVAAAALGNIQTYEQPDTQALSTFVCTSFQRYPVKFRPLECSGAFGG